jgi:hypothetical protein
VAVFVAVAVAVAVGVAVFVAVAVAVAVGVAVFVTFGVFVTFWVGVDGTHLSGLTTHPVPLLTPSKSSWYAQHCWEISNDFDPPGLSVTS